jgi:putative flippase GtrA
LIFGVSTTLVNLVVYWMMAHCFLIDVMVSTVVACFFSVLFAYVTNRQWVFNSKVISTYGILKELFSFFTCRIFTGIIDWICMFVFVDTLHYQDFIIKIFSNFLVIILNYITSKVLIFKINCLRIL